MSGRGVLRLATADASLHTERMNLTSVPPDVAPRKGVDDRVRGIALFAAAAFIAFLLYRPDTNAPFEIIDFSETLPFLTGGRGFDERFHGLFRYYLHHGRAAIGLSAGLAAKWTLFGWWTPGWQWTRFVVGMAVVVLAWLLMRALGANRLGAAAGSALFIVSETAAPGWLRPSVNEPFGTMLLLSASLLACGYQAAEKPRRVAGAVAVLLAMMLMVKETLIAATFFPIAIALCRRPDGLLAKPDLSSRNFSLVASCVAALAVASAPVLWAMTQVAPDGYTQQFGAVTPSLSHVIFGLLPALIPFAPVTQPFGWVATVADIMWLLILSAGLRMAATPPRTRVHVGIVVILAVGLLATRVLVYLPWPYQYPFYSIPYLLGVSLVASQSVSGLSRGTLAMRILGFVSATIVLLYSAAGSLTQSARYMATRKLTNDLVEELHRATQAAGSDQFSVAVLGPPPQVWSGLGPTLSRFGNATGRHLPPGASILCEDAKRTLERNDRFDTVLATLRYQCVLPGKPSVTVHSVAYRFGRPDVLWAADTLYADVFITSGSRSDSATR